MGDGGQIKLLGFSGPRVVADEVELRRALSTELSAMKAALGARMTVICGAAPGADLVFLRACVEMRIPAIVIMPFPEERFSEDFRDRDEWILAQHLTSVALAKHVVLGGGYDEVSRCLLEWADAILFASGGGGSETILAARGLGIPSRVLEPVDLAATWAVAPDPRRKARHGFDSRADLLDFLHARFAEG